MPHLDASALARDPDGLATLAGVLRPFTPPVRVVRSGAEAGHPAAPRHAPSRAAGGPDGARAHGGAGLSRGGRREAGAPLIREHAHPEHARAKEKGGPAGDPPFLMRVLGWGVSEAAEQDHHADQPERR
jgi:hypothetical protein